MTMITAQSIPERKCVLIPIIIIGNANQILANTMGRETATKEIT
jgi:hypothetical protein